MQKCQKCSTQFNWKDILKSVFLGYTPIKCSKCNSTHNISLMTRVGYVTFAFALPLILVFTKLLNFRRYNLTIIYLLWVTLIICITPFLARYDIQEEKE